MLQEVQTQEQIIDDEEKPVVDATLERKESQA